MSEQDQDEQIVETSEVEQGVPELRLAGNHITGTGFVSWGQGYGHLQFVYDDGSGEEIEIEVQSPTWVTLGNWEVPIDNPDTPENEMEHNRPSDPDDYASITLLRGDAAEEAYGILQQARDQFREATDRDPSAFDYDKDNNSNSFVRTLGDMIGVDLEEHLPNVTPENVGGGFPGSERNVFSNPEENTDVIHMTLHGYDGDNTIRTDLGRNTLSGWDGRDDLSTGRDDDILIGARAIEPGNATARNLFEARADGFSPYDDGANDWLRGGPGDDLYIVGGAADENGQNSVIATENGEPVRSEDGAYYINPGLDIIDDADGEGRVEFSLDGYESTGRNHYGTFSGGTFTEMSDADTIYPRYSGEGELDILLVDNFNYQDQSGADVSGELYVFIDRVNEHHVFAITGHDGENFDITLQDTPEVEPAQEQTPQFPSQSLLTGPTPLLDVVHQLDADLPAVQDRIAARAADGTLTMDEALVGKALSQTGTAQTFSDLQAAGVTELNIYPNDPTDPMSRTQAALGAAGEALRENELPVPGSEYLPEMDLTNIPNETVELAMTEHGEPANDVLHQNLIQRAMEADLARAQEAEADYDYAI